LSRDYPEISVNVEGTEDVVDLRNTGTDIAIRYGRTQDVSLHTIPLLKDTYYAVAASDAVEKVGSNIDGYRNKQLLAYRWKLKTSEIPDWQKWFNNAEVNSPEEFRTSWFNDESLALHAMERGLGPILCSDILVADAIASRKVSVLEGPSIEGFEFKLALVPSSKKKKLHALFIDWITSEAEEFSASLQNFN
jgi:LysR family transcriptional regulator, glycine cleavage system transcriptional activator